MKHRNLCVKVLLLGFCLTWFGGFLGQGQGAFTFGAQDALISLSQAVLCFDTLLLENDGLLSGTLQDKTLTMELENGAGSRAFNREDIDTLELATESNGLVQDRVTLWSQEVFQGNLQATSFQVQLASGGDVTLARAQVQGTLFVSPAGGDCSGGLTRLPSQEEIRALFRRLINNSLTPLLVGSLSKYDWVLLSNRGIVSGAICDEQFTLNLEGQEITFSPQEVSAILFARALDSIWLKTGDFLEGKLSGSEVCLSPTYQQGNASLGRGTTARGVIFRTILSGGGQ